MYNFHVIEGKKLISYKPTKEHYLLAICRCLDKLEGVEHIDAKDWKARYPENFKHYLYLAVKFIPKVFDFKNHYDTREIEQWFKLISDIGNMISQLTPREFLNMFPVEKEYDGQKYQTKDYFFTMDAINQMEIDNPIGEQVHKFLFDYTNWDINFYMVTWMGIVNRMHQEQGGKDIALEFFEEQGTPLHPLYEKDGYLVNGETGEKFKLEKPKNKLKKLFSVV